jgi:RNA polymerase sigma-70 factor, ECF subfamily
MTELIANQARVWTDDAIQRHAARLYRSAMGLTRNAVDAEDLVQETFTKAFAASGQFQPGTNLGGWLYRIMFNTFADDYRKRRREPLLAADPATREADLPWARDSAEGRPADEHVLGRAVEAELVAAIRTLPPGHRLMVYLADMKGLGYRQIAEMTGVSIGTVKSSLHRGRVQLRTILGDQYRPREGRCDLHRRGLSALCGRHHLADHVGWNQDATRRDEHHVAGRRGKACAEDRGARAEPFTFRTKLRLSFKYDHVH